MNQIITVKQLQDYLHCSKTTAYELCKRRDFPAFKIGKIFYIRADLLDAWTEKECKKQKF